MLISQARLSKDSGGQVRRSTSPTNKVESQKGHGGCFSENKSKAKRDNICITPENPPLKKLESVHSRSLISSNPPRSTLRLKDQKFQRESLAWKQKK